MYSSNSIYDTRFTIHEFCMWQRIKNYYHLFQAIVAHVRYGFPYRGMMIIGVTGTDGKTTTSSLIYHLLKTSGYKTAMITTVGAYIGNNVYDVGFHVTTPSSDALFSYIQRARNEGITHLVLETTSHALDQYRVWGIPITIGVLTNITHEHLDYHKTYERYVDAKVQLLKRANTVVLNKDDQSYVRVLPRVRGKTILTYSFADSTASYSPLTYRFKRVLMGDYNARNILAAIAVVKTIGVSDASIRIGLDTYKPPKGRLDVVYDGPFRVIIDFAHTPNAFAQVLPAVKKETEGRLIHVFGAAGLRDDTKRPLMGEESARWSDIIILTSEDPRTEQVSTITGAVMEGIQKTWNAAGHRSDRENFSSVQLQREIDALHIAANASLAGVNLSKIFALTAPRNQSQTPVVVSIVNRLLAIQVAVALAQKGDTVIATGKAHETSMNYGSGEEPWDEYAVVRAALTARSRLK